ncbi:hypothetical protein HAV21_05540 [Paenarthrobacter sp. MSM-2-10-13]|uniref:hypothetical protein n=1 Tax=Paenarthrobacter sp. MSM-2-10-13 TaxID=2717318 RepID=UPI0014241C23|nr:hypothetical protein [Paenarthrobacter sp. MSM-2-10-13]NHW46357.1 hypothetical protein [Paenarthrobacter sp. MSM-2-10-13]
MTFLTRDQLIGLVLVPVVVLGLSACLPSGNDGLPSISTPNSTSVSPPATSTAQAASPEATSPQEASAEATATQAASTPDAVQTSPPPAATPQSESAPQQPTGVGPTGSPRSGSQPERAPKSEETAEAPPQEPTVVSWLPTGPIGSDDPAPGQRYLMLQQFQCDALVQSVEGAADAAVWQAGAAVCRALQTGRQDDWQQASVAVARTPRIPQKQCLEFRVAATSAFLVAQYRSNPGSVFEAEPGPGEACPRQLLRLTVVDEDLRPVIGMPRASGPTSGGTIVRLDGYYVRVGEVLFDGVPTVPDIVAGGGDYQALYLRMPPAEGRESIRISIKDTVEVAGTVTFFYVDPAVPGSTLPPAAEPAKEP